METLLHEATKLFLQELYKTHSNIKKTIGFELIEYSDS